MIRSQERFPDQCLFVPRAIGDGDRDSAGGEQQRRTLHQRHTSARATEAGARVAHKQMTAVREGQPGREAGMHEPGGSGVA